MAIEPVSVEPWELPGNSEWDSFQGRLRGVFIRDGQVYLLAKLLVRAKFWASPGGFGNSQLADDAHVVLSQFEIPRSRLKAAYSKLAAWLDSPSEIETIWADDNGQYLSVSLGLCEGVICSMEKPVCRIVYRTHRLGGEYRFVVDQSCVRLLAEGLDAWLRVTRRFVQSSQ